MGETIVFTSGKGGVGKTTTIANIGAGLSRLDKKVVMLDTDMGLRNLATVPTDLMRLYRRRFEEVPGIWRREYPQADISMLHGHHFNVMRLPETIAEIERESLRFLTE